MIALLLAAAPEPLNVVLCLIIMSSLVGGPVLARIQNKEAIGR
jgi:hypothetical protein